MKTNIFIVILTSITILFSSCTQTSAIDAEELGKKKFIAESNPVDVIVLEASSFDKEIISNGKLEAIEKCELKFKVSGQIQKLPFKNGDFITKGGTIATLESTETKQKFQQAEIQFSKAKLDREELLIGQGYSTDAVSDIPEKTLETANIRSGYSSAQNSLEEARLSLNKHLLKAPISGRVANLSTKKFESPELGKAFCMIINDTKFEVTFAVLEQELRDIKIGQKVEIVPFSLSGTFVGHIQEINPIVDENGMVNIKTVILNTGGLMEGMNAEVRVKKRIEHQLVVPKTAIVIRQDKEVLFTVKSGKAYWTYVHTTESNKTHSTVIANAERGAVLQAGDTVIVSNNLNLAHDSQIEVVKVLSENYGETVVLGK